MGITWYPKKDVFAVKITQEYGNKITKRIALADISRLFDPLGLLAPVVVTAKIFLQELWKLKLDWDAALPNELHTRWTQFRSELGLLQKINIPRHIFNHSTPKDVQLHIFADASEAAYGAAAYVRSIDSLKVITVRLLCSKSRVAPVKQITLPRLELCAAKLATDLAERLKEDKILPSSQVFFWSDSTAVLGWINASSSNYHTFVANRISAIQQASTPQQWHHVPSSQNPADLISRGQMPELLIENSQWFYGPLFLHAPITAWPMQPPRQKCDLELRQKTAALAVASPEMDSLFNTIRHGNSLRKLQRIMAYVNRFVSRIRQKSTSTSNKTVKAKVLPLTAIEMNEALELLVRISQREDFIEDINKLRKSNCVHTNSSISSLTPFMDKNGLLRVGGRLQASDLSYDAKHQMLLSYHHPLTKMIFQTTHKENQHVGAQTLLSLVRQRFWPLKGKNIARSTVQSCIPCTKARPKLMEQLMGSLPKDRVQPSRPFVNAGVDFFGPVWIQVRIRGKPPLKAYVAVFCCFSTKAVHLELVSDLSTDAFIGALRRFTARRGHCNKLYCDNATNFVGAKNQLRELQESIFPDKAQQKIQNECSKRNITFSFIPPRAPHFGGLWEAAVKSAKHLLYSTLSKAKLSREEMETVLAETEAIMNSRPLTPMSTDPNDLSALTPGHFLIGEPLSTPPDPNAIERHLHPVTRWKLVTQLKHEFWRRWSSEYLYTLQERGKWKKECPNITPGTMVLIKDDNTPTFEWAIGRIKNVIPGDDGLVRVADVQTSRNIIRRPIAKLAPLPTEQFDHTKTDISQDRQNRAKRPRLSNALTTMLMIFVFILPLCLGNPVDVLPFNKNPGLYYEKLGPARITNSDWNLISYIDMKSYWKRFNTIKHYPVALQHAANESHSLHGNTIAKLLDGLLAEIEQQNQLLLPIETTRQKRGAFNVVGNVANALFGVLDSTYAEEAEKVIQQIKRNEDFIVDKINKQTSFIDTTINVLKKNQAQVDHEIQQIVKVLNQLQNQVLKLETVSELGLQATLDMLQVERVQDSLIDVLVSAHHGRITPELISPRQLQLELQKIKPKLPSNIQLPVSTAELINLYKLMSIEGRATENYVIFKITIPLVANEDFELLRVYSVPWLENGSFLKIQQSITFLIINLHRDKYLPLQETDLASCVVIMNEYLCHLHRPMYNNGSSTAQCEVQILQSNSISKACKIGNSDPGPHWTQLQSQNAWLYSVPDKHVVNTVCGSTPGQLLLNRSGVLTLKADCIIKQPKMSIQGYQKFETTIHGAYIPSLDISEVLRQYQNTTTELKITPSISLDDVHDKLKQMRLELPSEIRPHDIHHYVLIYGCLAAILIVAYVVFRKLKTFKLDDIITIPV